MRLEWIDQAGPPHALRVARWLFLAAWTCGMLSQACPGAGPDAAGDDGLVEGLVLPAKRIELGSPLETIVREVLVEEGERVRAGQPLAILYSEQEKLLAARAAKQLEQAEFIHKADERLAEQRAVSREKAMESRIAFELAQIQRDLAEANIEEKTLRAPVDGRIIRVERDPGETIGRSEVLIELLNYETVKVQMYLPGELIGGLREGDLLTVRIPLAGAGEMRAEVSYVDPVIDAGSGLFRALAEIPNTDRRIKPGMEALVRLPEGARQ